MHLAARWLSLLALALVACVSAAPEPAPVETPPRSAAEAMHRAMAVARALHRPDDVHREFEAFEGDWDVRVEGRLSVSDPFEHLAHGRARLRRVLDGRFVEWHVQLEAGDDRHAVLGLFGYDVVRGEYQALWASDLATSLTLARGDGDPFGRGLVLYGPGATGGEGAGRDVLRFLDRESFVIESGGTDALGGEGVLRRTVYSRSP